MQSPISLFWTSYTSLTGNLWSPWSDCSCRSSMTLFFFTVLQMDTFLGFEWKKLTLRFWCLMLHVLSQILQKAYYALYNINPNNWFSSNIPYLKYYQNIILLFWTFFKFYAYDQYIINSYLSGKSTWFKQTDIWGIIIQNSGNAGHITPLPSEIHKYTISV